MAIDKETDWVTLLPKDFVARFANAGDAASMLIDLFEGGWTLIIDERTDFVQLNWIDDPSEATHVALLTPNREVILGRAVDGPLNETTGTRPDWRFTIHFTINTVMLGIDWRQSTNRGLPIYLAMKKGVN